MTYSETFNVQSWLEDEAKWLRWAMQSLTARNLDDVRYNLQQFWGALATAKGQASTPLDWGDILTLDSQSQWTLGQLYQNDQADLLKQLNDVLAISGFGSYATALLTSAPIIIQNAETYKRDATAATRDRIASLGSSAAAAFDAQKTLAGQAQKAYRDARNTSNQATNSLTVGNRASKENAENTALNLQQAGNIGKPTPFPSLDFLKVDLFGLPAWAWLGGAAAIALVVTTGPTVVMASTAYRKATA